ncbi:MAG TPA: AGE family epimerase/isomerase [bacterium]|nr:AGE family epimerase/isomerase [bacterium]
MTRTEIAAFRTRYEENLAGSVIPFWERHSLDPQEGGYFTCLERDGTVFDTDKFVWMQGREVWGFSLLHRLLAPEARWVETARRGAEFLRTHGRAENGDWYFALDRAGRPLVHPYNIFADCFCAVAFGEYHRASGEDWARDLAIRTWRRIQERKSNPKGRWTKQVVDNRRLLAMNWPMMSLWMAWELRGILPASELVPIEEASARQVLDLHVDRKARAVFERVLPDGGRLDSMDGRLLTPGHALETLWFLMQWAEDRGDRAMIDDLAEVMLWVVDRGWDETFGGIYYYQDFQGFPTEKLEAGMKLWWVHAEALCAFLLAYRLTGRAEHEQWFRRIHEWTWSRFPDPVHGEWFGYLDRRGEPALSLKGGKWKGFFHVPRTLLACSRWLRQMEDSCRPDGQYVPAAGRRT